MDRTQAMIQQMHAELKQMHGELHGLQAQLKTVLERLPENVEATLTETELPPVKPRRGKKA